MPDTGADRRGQAAEWLLWTALTLSSPLHVFLPLRDMGIDGIVRLPGTDVAAAIQVKSRHVMRDGKLHLLVRDSELHDHRAVIVAVVLDPARQRLADTAICVDVPTFMDLGFRRDGADHGYQASIPFPPDPTSRWHPFAVPISDLATRLLPVDRDALRRVAIAELAASELSATTPFAFDRSGFDPFAQPSPTEPGTTAALEVPSLDVGYRGESRLLALLATDPRLNTFKAFPDLEMVEYCVRHVGTGGIAGIQVKAISVDPAHPRGTIKVPPHTYRPTPLSWFTVLAESRHSLDLHPSCLLIPSMDMADLLIAHSGTLTVTWDPDSPRHDAAVAPYRLPTAQLAARLASLLE